MANSWRHYWATFRLYRKVVIVISTEHFTNRMRFFLNSIYAVWMELRHALGSMYFWICSFLNLMALATILNSSFNNNRNNAKIQWFCLSFKVAIFAHSFDADLFSRVALFVEIKISNKKSYKAQITPLSNFKLVNNCAVT